MNSPKTKARLAARKALAAFIARRPELTRRDVLAVARTLPVEKRHRRPRRPAGMPTKAALELGRRLSARAFADLAGVQIVSVRAWERGDWAPEPYAAAKLGEALNLPAETFLPKQKESQT